MLRINARLDDSYAEKLEYLKDATGLTLSDLVRESVEHYYIQIKAAADQRRAGLDSLVGAFEGNADTPRDLSADCKRYLWPDDHDVDADAADNRTKQ